jgi:glycosyltransferase involved in cell wall biosynthesis
VGGLADLELPGAVLVPPGDRAALRQAVVRFLDDPEAARRAGAGAREAVRGTLAAAAAGARLAAVYEEASQHIPHPPSVPSAP